MNSDLRHHIATSLSYVAVKACKCLVPRLFFMLSNLEDFLLRLVLLMYKTASLCFCYSAYFLVTIFPGYMLTAVIRKY